MAGKLTALRVTRLAQPGMYPDGDGLYLQVTGAGAKSWIYRYSLAGKAREMGLGSLNAVGLADARTMAADCRKQRAAGIDPIEARKRDKAQARLDEAKTKTFKEARTEYIATHRASWSNAKHADQWENTLATYADPVIGAISVQAIDTALIQKVLKPIWETKTETASRVRNRMEAILDWCTANEYRKGDNPARWRGHLSKLLPAPNKVKRVAHHAALPYDEIPVFMAALRTQEGTAARALELTILTASRTGETTGAAVDEFNVEKKMWIVPSDRMKGRRGEKREHRKPLSSRALALIKKMKAERDPDFPFLFPGGKRGKPLSENAMLALLARMGMPHITVHGFRSTFKDWASERTNFANEISEMALAHVVGDKTEAAYRRGDLLEKRRRLMDDWATYCESKPVARGKVIPLSGGRTGR